MGRSCEFACPLWRWGSNHRGRREILESAAEIFFQDRWFCLLRVAALCRRVGALLENIAVAGAHHQLRPVNPHLYFAPLTGIRGALRIITKTVLTPQLFSYRTKRHVNIDLFRVVE